MAVPLLDLKRRYQTSRDEVRPGWTRCSRHRHSWAVRAPTEVLPIPGLPELTEAEGDEVAGNDEAFCP